MEQFIFLKLNHNFSSSEKEDYTFQNQLSTKKALLKKALLEVVAIRYQPGAAQEHTITHKQLLS